MKKNKTEGAVDVVFTVPSFRYNGKEYKSAAVEKAAEEGDEDALAIIAHLVKKGSGIVQVLGEADDDSSNSSEDLTPLKAAEFEKTPKQPKAPKAPKAPKSAKEPKAKKPAKSEKGDSA